jgi:predicted transposase/invertase (TIGR01784 family)
VISVAVVYFDLGKGTDYIYHGTTTFKGLHNNEELTLNALHCEYLKKEHPSELFPEMYVIKVKNFDDVARNTLDEWIYFLKNGKIKDNFRAKGLKKAQKKLDVLKMSEKERKEYEAYLADLSYQASMVSSSYGEGKFDGIKEGMEKGDQLRCEKIALKMISKGKTFEEISEITELSIKQIKQLAEKNKVADTAGKYKAKRKPAKPRKK